MPGMVEKMEKKLARSLSEPSHVWWDGPQDVAKSRDLAEVDQYRILDRENGVPGQGCVDKRFRMMGCTDTTRMVQFGPTPSELKGRLHGRLPEARPETTSFPLSFKLDPYNAKLGDTFVNKDRSKRLVWGTYNPKDRFVYRKIRGKDFTQTGASTNTVYTDLGPRTRKRTPSGGSVNMPTLPGSASFSRSGTF